MPGYDDGPRGTENESHPHKVRKPEVTTCLLPSAPTLLKALPKKAIQRHTAAPPHPPAHFSRLPSPETASPPAQDNKFSSSG